MAVRSEMKRTNDIMSEYLFTQKRSGQNESIFMALQFLPKEYEEYKELTRRFLASINDGDTECRNIYFSSQRDEG